MRGTIFGRTSWFGLFVAVLAGCGGGPNDTSGGGGSTATGATGGTAECPNCTSTGGTTGGTGGATGGTSTGGATGGTGGGQLACDGSPLSRPEFISAITSATCAQYNGCCPNGFNLSGINIAPAECVAILEMVFDSLGDPADNPNFAWNDSNAGICCNTVAMRFATDTCADPSLFGPAAPAVECDNLTYGLLPLDAACTDSRECSGGSLCENSVCTAAANEGQSCANASCYEFAWLYCDPADTTCQPRKPNGSACNDSDECQSGICQASTCTPYVSYASICL